MNRKIKSPRVEQARVRFALVLIDNVANNV